MVLFQDSNVVLCCCQVKYSAVAVDKSIFMDDNPCFKLMHSFHPYHCDCFFHELVVLRVTNDRSWLISTVCITLSTSFFCDGKGCHGYFLVLISIQQKYYQVYSTLTGPSKYLKDRFFPHKAVDQVYHQNSAYWDFPLFLSIGDILE